MCETLCVVVFVCQSSTGGLEGEYYKDDGNGCCVYRGLMNGDCRNREVCRLAVMDQEWRI